MTLLVEAPAAYEPERRYILDVVLGDWLGLECGCAAPTATTSASPSRTSPTGRCVLVPDVLFATPLGTG